MGAAGTPGLMRRLAVLAVLFLGAGLARAEDERQAADAVLAAVRAKDDAALRALAARDEPDPWLVADELLARGEPEAALSFAGAVPRADTEGLPGYVAAHRADPPAPEERAALARSTAAMTEKRPQEALDLLGPPPPGTPGSVREIRESLLRGSAAAALRRPAEAAPLLRGGADAAERAGWLSAAWRALDGLASQATLLSDLPLAREACDRALRVAARRGDRRGEAWMQIRLADVHRRQGDFPAAIGLLERGRATMEELGEHAGIAAAFHNLGNLLQTTGDRAGALRAFERALTEYEALENRAAAAGVRGNIGVVHKTLGDFPKALEAFERVLAEQRALGDRAGAAGTLGNLATVHEAQGDCAKALEAYGLALAEFEALGDREAAARTLSNIGLVRCAQGDYAKALEDLERARAQREAIGDRVGAARTLGSLAAVHQSMGGLRQARELLERALEAQEALGDRVGAARTLGNLGAVHRELGHLAQAVAFDERALEGLEALGDRWGVARALANLGDAHSAMGAYAKALEHQERALAAAEALGDRTAAAATLGNIGSTHARLGDHASALRYQERALREKEALGDRAGAAQTLANIGRIHDSRGDYAKALDVLERALEASARVGDRASAAATSASLGRVYLSLGNGEKALAHLEHAHEEQMAIGDRASAAWTLLGIARLHYQLGDHDAALEAIDRTSAHEGSEADRARVASAMNLRGAVHLARGEPEKARQAFERMRETQEALGNRTGVAQALGNLGGLLAATGEPAKAVELLDRALEVQEAYGQRASAAISLANLANVHEARGDPAAALAAARRGVLLLPGLVGGLGEEQGAVAREQYRDLFDVGVRAAVAADDPAELAFFVESGRAGSLLESFASRESLRAGVLPVPLLAAEAEARAKASATSLAYRRAADGGDRRDTRERRREMEAARHGLESVIERIHREAKRAAGVLYPEPATLEEMRGTLAPDEALVLYSLAGSAAVALVVTAEGGRIVALPTPPQALAERVTGFRPSDPRTTVSVDLLRRSLVEPLGLPASAKRLRISPDGALSEVPFGLLMPEREVAYVPSGTVYRALLEERDLRGEGVLAIGDPDYREPRDPRALALVRGGVRLTPLPATREEARAVGTVTLLGPEATEAGVRTALARRTRWRAVHFACHGRIDPERPAFSSLALSPSEEDDGFLTALELFRASVPADLVVLSACETARGKVIGAEGIVGLTRAFMFAGSPRVICSLWEVDDEATRILMTDFYARWKAGVPTARALKEAQESVRSHERWAHPHYWAAWVLWGLGD